MELRGRKIAFLGDSITQGVGVSCESCRFPDLIARETAPSWPPEMDRHFMTRLDEIEPDADAIVVFGGTNDFGHGDAPLGQFADRTEDAFYGALHLLMQELMTRFPAARILFLTPLHRLDEPLPGEEGRVPLAAYVRAIREVAEWYALPVLDLYATSGMQLRVETNRLAYMPDGLHPNDAGHRILADRIIACLRQR